jgi:hypothetical protein
MTEGYARSLTGLRKYRSLRRLCNLSRRPCSSSLVYLTELFEKLLQRADEKPGTLPVLFVKDSYSIPLRRAHECWIVTAMLPKPKQAEAVNLRISHTYPSRLVSDTR